VDKQEACKWAAKRIRAQVLRKTDTYAALANTAAILKEYRPDFFWVGFYFVKKDHLLLGPFQGPPACVKLTLDKGVCAACAREKQTILVPDVHQFPGHVACDKRSRSEIVVPVFDATRQVQAVLDIDSDKLNAFAQSDADSLQEIAALLAPLW